MIKYLYPSLVFKKYCKVQIKKLLMYKMNTLFTTHEYLIKKNHNLDTYK